MYNVIVHKRAVKYLNSIPDNEKKGIKNVLKKLEANPFQYSGARSESTITR